MLSAVRTTAYSVIAVGSRHSGASRRALPDPVLEHFSLRQLCHLDATAYKPLHAALAIAVIVPAWRMSISSQAGAAVPRNVAWGNLRGLPLRTASVGVRHQRSPNHAGGSRSIRPGSEWVPTPGDC